MSEAKKNDAPSAEAINLAQRAMGRWTNSPTIHSDLALEIDALLARVRREARAEAFEEMRAEFQVNDMNRSAELCEALAAKERAK